LGPKTSLLEVSETLLDVARQLQPNSANAPPYRQRANVTLTALQAVEKLGKTVGH